MTRKMFFPLFALIALSLACRESATVTPASIASATSIVIEQTAVPATEAQAEDNSFINPNQSTRLPIKELQKASRDIQRDVTYCAVNGVELKMDVYFPKNAEGVTPLVVFIHGGGWSVGDKRSGHGMTEFPALLEAGFTVATLNYRLAPEYVFPAQLEDVKCAIRSLRANVDKYGIDPDRIGVWGTSAGAHLASMIGLTDKSAGFDVGEYLDQSSRVRVVIDMSGPADLTTDFSPGFVEAKNEAFPGYDLVKASPITHITSDDPPFLILQGNADVLVPVSQGEMLYNGLINAEVQAQLVIVDNGNHTLTAPYETPPRAELTQMVVQFFVDHLK